MGRLIRWRKWCDPSLVSVLRENSVICPSQAVEEIKILFLMFRVIKDNGERWSVGSFRLWRHWCCSQEKVVVSSGINGFGSYWLYSRLSTLDMCDETCCWNDLWWMLWNESIKFMINISLFWKKSFESKRELWWLFVIAGLCRLCFWANGDMRYKQRASIGKPGPTGWIIILRDSCFVCGEVTIWSMVYANGIKRERLISDCTEQESGRCLHFVAECIVEQK